MSCPARNVRLTYSAVFFTKDKSGSRFLLSGVGTQMTMTSAYASSPKLVVARNRLLARIAAVWSSETVRKVERP
jgi:hypothetical protein